MGKEVGLILKMVYSDDILVNGIVEVGDIQVPRFFAQFDVFKIAHRIIGEVSKQAIVDKLKAIGCSLELPAELVDEPCHIRIGHYLQFFLPAIRVAGYECFALGGDRGYGIATYIGK